MTSREGAPAPWRKAAIGSAIAIGIVAVLVAALELGARALHDGPFVPGLPAGTPEEGCAVFDPDRGWRNKPGVRTRVVAPKFSYTVTINSHGLRDREHDVEKPDGVFRIALLGDSVAWGWGVDDGLGFADLLDDRLGASVEVINLAVPGYSTDQQLETLRTEGRAYRPDLVLLCFVLNDVLGNNADTGYMSGKPQWLRSADGTWARTNHPVPKPKPGETRSASLRQRLYAHSALLQALNPPDEEGELERAAERIAPPKSNAVKRESYERYREGAARLAAQLVDADSATHMLLGRLVQTCEELDAPLVAFSVAHHHDRYLYQVGPYRPPIPEGEPFRTDVSLRLAEAGENLGFETLSVDDAFLREVDAGQNLHVGDGHPNERAHRLIADELADFLEPRVREFDGGGE